MSTIKQDPRRIAIDTPLGADKLLLQGFSGQEEMSRLFSYDLDLRSEDKNLKASDIVGKNVTIRVELPEGDFRYFNGVIQRFAYCGTDDRLSIYRATMVPWLWFLTRTSDCRIFQEKSVPDVIKQVFSDLGFSDFEVNLQGTHNPWDYNVQYRETDFNFVSRLMEEEGIFYFFKHEKGKHILVLGDKSDAYKTCKEKQVNFQYNLGDLSSTDELNSWMHQYEFRTGKWAHTDYNFETPITSLMAKTNSKVKIGDNSKFEFYDYPGEYEKKADGDNDVTLRMEEEEVGYDVVRGTSSCRSFSPGHKFTVAKHHNPSEQGGYVLTSVRHQASIGGSYVGGGADTGGYENSFTCIPDKVVFRPARTTPKPLIHGVQTAVVVGPAGEEIYVDKYGRVKVQFHWDREGQKDEKSSCWIRVGQTSAGRKWGSMFIPRIGQEVIVTYLEGDPDRPLITGEVYNEQQMPPYELPDHKTKSCIKTNSSPGGDGFNEIRFEDKMGSEQLFMHAERDMDVMVKRNHQEHVGGDKLLMVGGGDSGGDGNFDIQIEKNKTECIKGDEYTQIKGDRKEKITGTQSLQVNSLQEKVNSAWAIESGQSIHIKAGMNLVIEAGMQLSLKVGGNFVDISVAGVAINGMPMVMINSGGAAGSGMGSSPQDPKEAKEAKPMEYDTAESGSKSS